LRRGIVIGFMLPKWLLGRIAAKRRERANQELPLFIDLLRLLQGVGLSLDQSLQIMASDFSHVLRVLGYELTLANSQYSRGRTREHSLHASAPCTNENLRGHGVAAGAGRPPRRRRAGTAAHLQRPVARAPAFGDEGTHRKDHGEDDRRHGDHAAAGAGHRDGGPGFIAIFRSLGAVSK
jgi:hypothetical protein